MVTLHIVYTLQACDQILYNKILTIKKYRIYIYIIYNDMAIHAILRLFILYYFLLLFCQ